MKRYALFVMCSYYPQGGMGDFVHDGDTIEELQMLLPLKCEYSSAIPCRQADGTVVYEYRGDEAFAEIYDTHEMKVAWHKPLYAPKGVTA